MEFLYQKFKIADLKMIAKERGGKCLSPRFSGIYEMYDWKCNRKHVWSTNFYNVYLGRWCNKCYNIERVKKSLEKITEFAIHKGGKCLTSDADNDDSLVKLKCSKGHIWDIKPSLKEAKRTWCPECGKR